MGQYKEYVVRPGFAGLLDSAKISLCYFDGNETFQVGDALYSQFKPKQTPNGYIAIAKRSGSGKYDLIRDGKIEISEADACFMSRRYRNEVVLAFCNDIEPRFHTVFWNSDGRVESEDYYEGFSITAPKYYCENMFEMGKFTDPEGNVIDEKQIDVLDQIFCKPSSFLELQTEDFKDKAFVKAALVAVKNGIRTDMATSEIIPDDYVELTEQLTTSIMDKTKSEFAKIEEMNLADEKARQDREQKEQKVESLLGGLKI